MIIFHVKKNYHKLIMDVVLVWMGEHKVRHPRLMLIQMGRMYSLGEMNFIQGMHDLGNCKNSVGLKPNAELRKDAKAPSIPKS